MAEIWRDGDSARLMTQKFNDLVREYDKLKVEYEGKLGTLPEVVEQLVEDMDKKLETVTKEDIGLGDVDNTPDLEKPVSAFQRNAINFAVREKLTSMPADYLGDGEDVDFQSWASENLATKDELEQKADKTELDNFPTKTGEGASGTWDIDISGTADKATNDKNGKDITTEYWHVARYLGTSDLNTRTTQGVYFQNRNVDATSGKNYPVELAGALLVMENKAGADGSCTHTYYPYNSNTAFQRTYNASSTTWSSWVELAFNLNGATDSRPTGVSVGTCYFDTTLGKPIWYNGTDWVDSTGTTV